MASADEGLPRNIGAPAARALTAAGYTEPQAARERTRRGPEEAARRRPEGPAAPPGGAGAPRPVPRLNPVGPSETFPREGPGPRRLACEPPRGHLEIRACLRLILVGLRAFSNLEPEISQRKLGQVGTVGRNDPRGLPREGCLKKLRTRRPFPIPGCVGVQQDTGPRF